MPENFYFKQNSTFTFTGILIILILIILVLSIVQLFLLSKKITSQEEAAINYFFENNLFNEKDYSPPIFKNSNYTVYRLSLPTKMTSSVSSLLNCSFDLFSDDSYIVLSDIALGRANKVMGCSFSILFSEPITQNFYTIFLKLKNNKGDVFKKTIIASKVSSAEITFSIPFYGYIKQ